MARNNTNRHPHSRYNLKRRVASLPPISSEVFTEKVLQARASTTAEAERAGFQKECTVCQRTYYSENSYQNHVGSQKHRAKEAAQLRGQNGPAINADDASSVISSTFSLGDPVSSVKSGLDSDAEEEFSHIVEGMKTTGIQDRPSPVKRPSNPHLVAVVDQQDEVMTSQSTSEQQPSTVTPVPPKANGATPVLSIKSCLFCNQEAQDLASNVAHMERSHGMFIPEKQYLVDLEGLLASLQQRIQEFHECLVCGRVKSNAFAAQTHMRDTGHCKIPYTTEEEQLEIGEFYDFRGTYSDDGEDMDSDDEESTYNGGARLGGKRATTLVNEDGAEIAEDEGWETDSSASSLDSADLTAVPAENHYHQYERLEKHPHHSRKDSRPHHQKDGWHSHSHKPTRAVFYDDYELHLPSGKSVGHRSLNRYFRQNLRDRPSPEEQALQRQLAIENGQDPDAMDVDGDDGSCQQLVARGRGRDQNRQLASRANGGLGMLGVSDKKKKEVKKAEMRSRKVANAQSRRGEWAVNKQANHQKYYHYSIL